MFHELLKKNTSHIFHVPHFFFSLPHIFSKTDAELAYGLAWAHAEDDFETIQKAYLAGNSLLSKLLGIKGSGADFVTQFIGSKELIDQL